ncbi:hypothetical protein RvY_00356-2 [Ramazzottius varieornatus]|uniref:Protein Wnt n=1 Tax=Ramazzottius varieornatus TaxID=947166 RepID=A0A1D1UCY7_RAMVA|nr:hypothetical protein RvY_00356-2 [Ramazzottius varieornatus]
MNVLRTKFTYMDLNWLLFLRAIIVGLAIDGSAGIKWLSLSKSNLTWTSTQHCRLAFKYRTLDRGQAQFCKRYLDTMKYVTKASKDTRTACQTQFFHNRWNCSSVELAPNFMNDLKYGTREQAYVAALSSASVVHAVAKGCASGTLTNCNCGPMPNEPPSGDYKWGGCGDDVVFGMKVSRLFTDIPYSFKYFASQENQGKLKKKDKLSKLLVWKKSRQSRAALNLHNQFAGRKMVEAALTRHCKCHGVSGSCQIRTCWKSLPTVKEISERLYRSYKRAVEVSECML